MPPTEDLTELIVAITGLVAAAAGLIAAFRQVHARIDQSDDALINHIHLAESSSTKVLPPDNPE